MKKEEKTEITKNKIFAAAMQEFGKNGYAAGSVNNICKTGINKGLIYHNFKDKDELYLKCVKKSCEDLICFVTDRNGKAGFVEYMTARMEFFKNNEAEARIFLEARTRPPRKLADEIKTIYKKFDELNLEVFEAELSRHKLRDDVEKADVLNYFMEMQQWYNLNFAEQWDGNADMDEQIMTHEKNIYKVLDFMLYGIAKRS